MCSYKIIVCTDGMMVDMCPSALLASSSMLLYWMNVMWFASVVGLCRYNNDIDLLVSTFMQYYKTTNMITYY